VAERLARYSLRSPGRAVIVAVVATLVALGVGAPVVRTLKSSLSDYDDPASDSVRAVSALKTAGVDPEPDVTAVATASDPRAVPALVRRTVHLGGGDSLVARIDAPSLRTGRGLSRDRRTAFVSFYFRPSSKTVARSHAVHMRHRLQGSGVLVGGAILANADLDSTVTSDVEKAELIGFPLVFVLLLLVFGGAIPAALPLGVASAAIAGSLVVLQIVEQFTAISVLALNLVTGLGLGLAVDYSLLIIARYREELTSHDPPDALRTAMRTAGRTVMFSAGTVSLALASLFVFPQRFFHSMAIGGISVTVFAALVAVAALPGALLLLGRRVLRGGIPGQYLRAGEPAASGRWYRLARAVTRRPGLVAVATATLLVVCALPLLGVTFSVFRASNLPADTSARKVNDALEAKAGLRSTSPYLVAVEAPRSARVAVSGYGARVAAVPGVRVVSAPRPVAPHVWSLTAERAVDPLGGAAYDTLRAIRGVAAPAPALVTGPTATFRDRQTGIGRHVPGALLLLGVVTFATLFLMTGSVVIPVKTFLLNLTSIAAALGIVVFVFQHGRLEGLLGYTSQGAIDSPLMTLLFVLVFALATDYGVFVLSRIKEAHDGGLETNDAIAVGLDRSGRIVTAAAALLCVALVVLAVSRLIFVKELAIGSALAVLIDATIVRALLLPALMALLGGLNWWAPKPFLSLRSRLGLERVEGEATRG
jgi:uncharacterized membrane protein YdfJ with MMPL/SSD domain